MPTFYPSVGCHRRARKPGWRHRSASCFFGLLPLAKQRSREERVHGGLSCEIVQTYARMISHDWHVQPSCQRPNRGPPGRGEFSPGENARMRIRLSSKLYNHTLRGKSRQSPLPTEFPDDFHIGKGTGERTSEAKAHIQDEAWRHD